MGIARRVSVLLLAAMSLPAWSATRADVDKLTTYAVVLGRGVACGADVRDPMARVGRWMDTRFPPGSDDQRTYLPIFIEGVQQHAQQHKDGRSPDGCRTVLKTFSTFPWP